MCIRLALALLLALLAQRVTAAAAQNTATTQSSSVVQDPCAYTANNPDVYRSCQEGVLQRMRSDAQRAKERELGLPALGALAVLTVLALFVSRKLQGRGQVVVIISLMLVLVAAVLAIFNTEAAGAFGAAVAAASGALLAAKGR
jgi:hypothetical protein